MRRHYDFSKGVRGATAARYAEGTNIKVFPPRRRRPTKFLVIVEKAAKNYSAYSPDLPGCVATASTRAATLARMKSAIRFHLEGLRAEGQRIRSGTTSATYVEFE